MNETTNTEKPTEIADPVEELVMPKYMDYPQPRLSIVETIGGYFRVEVHGKDSVQNNLMYAVMDIGRGPTKEAALQQAREWFDSMVDRTADGA